ncbi:hypothetical protein [Thalassotalea sp. PP2-459]|uniref:hypothetical protein n=1 Tax=Thalassotalea sp. PP2-459 TaxID=1742724 RepID=UPI0009F9CE65|nr:hypothetical protein [Thalassotalea sp. PP2-459]
MDKVVLMDAVPSIMSAIAGVAAAIAAFFSLKISKEAKDIAKQSALAAQHHTAASLLSDSIVKLKETTEELSNFSQDLVHNWSSHIGRKDESSKGGVNPRPLRHVLSNAAGMLVTHAIESQKSPRHVHSLMYSIVRDGVRNLNEDEFKSLLKKADHSYTDFEGVLGRPSIKGCITESRAFRWAFYQLSKRVAKSEWKCLWDSTWQEDGWLYLYEKHYSNVKPTIADINQSLKYEKAKLAHTVFPLESNPRLSSNYNKVISITDSLLEDCDLDSIKPYINCSYEPDFIELIVYSMGIAELTSTVIEDLYKYDLS